MLKEKNKPIYKGIIALFSTILVILLAFTINIKVNADTIAGEYQYYALDYEETPTFTYSYASILTNDFNVGLFKPFETLIPFYVNGTVEVFENAPYIQYTHGNDSLVGDLIDVTLYTYGGTINDFSISFNNEIQYQTNIDDLRQINYYFEDFYYEQEDYEMIPRIYTLNSDKYYNIEYLVDAEYLNPTTHKMERKSFTQSIFATQEFYLIPNIIGYIYTLAPGETYPNTLFKVHYAQCYISLNQETTNGGLHYDNYFVYHCLDNATSEYYDDIDEKFYNIKANNQNSVTETLGEQIGGFLDIEILPGLSFLGIYGLALGIPLLVWILKLFFGG